MPKFQIGDIIVDKNNPIIQREIVEIIGKSTKSIEGNWCEGATEVLVGPNSYVLKNLETNKLSWGYVSWTHEKYQLFKPVIDKPLKWKNYQEILV